ncbi:hypothetical protein [Deinococcus arcticus]|uniref:Uncharacterized protein n=1 Tax=Deinococcus arcticus TaxID=2136176 RepID=A0A2T3W4X5_9DEIO|nr:hypothetical protein [Deinococcus arcticus]PTA66941.1 hypothetical protein C8263_15350 [Deinococcus arcticus]
MNAKQLLDSDREAWVRLIALERTWGQPRDEILATALQECRGVRSELNARLKAWMYPDRNAVLASGERLFGRDGRTVRRTTGA